VGITKNMPQVSIWSGHSVAELRKSYWRPQLEGPAKKWFSIQKETAENVLQMAMLSFGSR
jgi:hypothetical protein